MPRPISSTDWTGTAESASRQYPFTYGVGQHSITSDHEQIFAARRPLFDFPSETRTTRRLAVWLLFSPVLLWLSWLFAGFATPDQLVTDHSSLLLFGGLGLMVAAAWQVQLRSTAFIGLRNAVLAIALAATCVVAILYPYLAVDAHSRAIASIPERTFELVKTECHRIKRTIVWHQRADGSNVEGRARERPLPYSHTCALVQRLDGPNGFAWVKVIERSRAPGSGQLSWPIRRDDCFSNVPLSSLPR